MVISGSASKVDDGSFPAGLIGDDHIVAEIGKVLSGGVRGRRTAEEITAYKSLGMWCGIWPRHGHCTRRIEDNYGSK